MLIAWPAAIERFHSDNEDSLRMRRESRCEFELKYSAERNYMITVDIFQEAIDIASRSLDGSTQARQQPAKAIS